MDDSPRGFIEYLVAGGAIDNDPVEAAVVVDRHGQHQRTVQFAELKRQLSLVAYVSGGATTAVLDYGEFLGRKTEKYKKVTDVLKKKTLAMHQANYIDLAPKLYNLVEKLQPIVAYAKTLPG